MRCWIYSSCDTLSLPLFFSLLPPFSLSTPPLLSLSSLYPIHYLSLFLTSPSFLFLPPPSFSFLLLPPPPFLLPSPSFSFLLLPSSSFLLLFPSPSSHYPLTTLSLSRGAFSIVKRVTHIKTAQDYAAKIINTRRLTSRGTNCDVIVMT